MQSLSCQRYNIKEFVRYLPKICQRYAKDMLQIQDNYLKQIYVKDIYIEAREERGENIVIDMQTQIVQNEKREHPRLALHAGCALRVRGGLVQ